MLQHSAFVIIRDSFRFIMLMPETSQDNELGFFYARQRCSPHQFYTIYLQRTLPYLV
jgi:hypothetical protein